MSDAQRMISNKKNYELLCQLPDNNETDKWNRIYVGEESVACEGFHEMKLV